MLIFLIFVAFHQKCTSLDSESQQDIYSKFLNVVSPIAFRAILPDQSDPNSHSGIPLDMTSIKALEHEIVAVLLNNSSPFEAIAEFKKVYSYLNNC